jgi:hypothetical protein
MDKFPEAFRRFEEKVNCNRIESFRQLNLAFGSWAGRRWKNTAKQERALQREARRIGIPVTGYSTVKREIYYVPKPVFAEKTASIGQSGFSKGYSSYELWLAKSARTSAYQQRVTNYLRMHPTATLAEARGHKTKRS